MKKAISIFTALTTVLWLSGVAMILPVANAVDFANGDLVREADEFDVYIVKLVGVKKFKRLILNPDVFNMYGHLNWADIQVVADGSLADYTTSELVRADGDEKVYKLFPDGDVGTKKWVDSLDCFTTMEYDWDSVYVINTFDRDSYTTAATTMCEEGVVAGDITLSLASDTPEVTSLPYNSHGVPFLKFDITGSGTITQMSLKRNGVGDAGDFNNVYLYEGDNRLTSGRSISSTTNKTTFIGLSIEAPATITLVGDLNDDTGDNGHINYFSIVSASDITSDATVGGSFPIAGNKMSITSIQGGTLTVSDNGSISNPTVGQKAAQVTQFKITGAYEPIDIYRITLYNGGTMNSPELTNLELKDIGGTVVATLDACGSDDLCTFVFDSPYELEKGDNKIFKVYADLQGDKDDTIGLYAEVSADVKGIGATYGAGTYVDISDFDGTAAGTDYHELTLEGGELTIAFNGPIAADVSDDTDDTVFLDLSFTAASDLEIRKMRVYLCYYVGGTATDIDGDIQDEVDDVKVKDKDTGTILMGPTDADNWSLITAEAVCSKDEIYKEWTDIWDLNAGETKNLQITGDIAVDTSTAADDGWKAVLYGYSGLSSAVKYRGTNDYIASGDIVPSTDITGNLMTIQASSIDVGLSSLPTGEVDAVKGQTGVEALALIFTAGEASDMELIDLVLTAFVDSDDEGDSYTIGVDGSLDAKEVVTNVTLYESDGTTKINEGGPKSFSDGTYDEDVTFDNLSWTIPAGESKKMIVKVDITTTDTEGNANDYVAIEIDAAANVTAVDSEGNSRNSDSATVNDSETVYVTKTDGGTLIATVAADGIRRDNTYVYQGQTGAEMSKFKFTSTVEAWLIDKLILNMENAVSTTETKFISKIELEYPVDASGTLVSPRPVQYFGSTASVTFDLTDEEMYVPKDDYAYLTVYADLSEYADAGDPGENNFSLYLECGDDAADFHATGVGSSDVYDGTEIDNDAGDIDSVEHMYIVRNFPSFTLDQSTGGVVAGMAAVDKILKFTITNNGDYDLVFDDTSGSLAFDVLGSGEINPAATFSLYKSDGTLIEDRALSNASGKVASCVFDFDDQLTTVTIPENGSESFYIKIKSGATQWDETGDFLKLQLDNIGDGTAGTDAVEWVDGGTTTQVNYIAGLKYIGIPLDGPTWIVNTN